MVEDASLQLLRWDVTLRNASSATWNDLWRDHPGGLGRTSSLDERMRSWSYWRKIVRQVPGAVQRWLKVAGGVVTLCNGDWKLLQSLQKVELSSTSCNVARNKNVARQVAEVTCYTVQFSCNLRRNGVARQVAEKIAQFNTALIFQFKSISHHHHHTTTSFTTKFDEDRSLFQTLIQTKRWGCQIAMIVRILLRIRRFVDLVHSNVFGVWKSVPMAHVTTNNTDNITSSYLHKRPTTQQYNNITNNTDKTISFCLQKRPATNNTATQPITLPRQYILLPSQTTNNNTDKTISFCLQKRPATNNSTQLQLITLTRQYILLPSQTTNNTTTQPITLTIQYPFTFTNDLQTAPLAVGLAFTGVGSSKLKSGMTLKPNFAAICCGAAQFSTISGSGKNPTVNN